MKDKPMQDAQNAYQRFKDARKQEDSETSRSTAEDCLAVIELIRSDQGAVLLNGVEGLGELAAQRSRDEIWLTETETEIRAYLKGAN